MVMTTDMVPAEFRRYAGLRPWLDDPFQRAQHMAFTLITEVLADKDTPFGRMARNGLLLTEKTASYLYDGTYGFLAAAYRPGSRPLLEKYIDLIAGRGLPPEERVIALSQSMDSLKERFGAVPSFLYGESDEQTLLKGGGHCSCRARLLCALCQVMGIEARPAMMWAWVDPAKPDKLLGGHTVAEVRLGGQWGFFDPQHHLYCRTQDGSFPGIHQIRQDPEPFCRMSRAEVDRMQPHGYPEAPEGEAVFRYYWYKNFNPCCPTSISRHDVNEPHYGPWTWATPEFRAKHQAAHDRFRAVLLGLAEQNRLTEEIYRMNVRQFCDYAGITDAPILDLVRKVRP